MPKLARNLRKKISITDGLGICRSCLHLSKVTCVGRVLVGSVSYFEAACAASKTRCHKTRRSLLECPFFKSSEPPPPTIWQQIINWFRSFFV